MGKSFALQLNTTHPRVPDLPTLAEQRTARQAEELARLDTLREVPPAELHLLASMATLRIFPEGSTILAEQTVGEHLFFLLHGLTRMTLHDKSGHEVLLGLLGRGDVFGEGMLFGDHFRRANVLSETPCQVLQFPLAELHQQIDHLPATEAILRRCYRGRLVESTLGRVPLLSRLSAVERVGIARLLQRKSFGRGMAIVYEGDIGDTLYVIEDGQVSVEQRDQVIAHLEDGDFFGEMSLLNRRPHNATVRALTPVDVLTLPGDSFRLLLQQQPDLATQLRAAVDERLRAGESLRSDRQRAQQLDTAVRRGLLRGSHLLVRDMSLCDPGCRICEHACAQRHGQPRLKAGGMILGQADVLDSCRQCRFGAECVEACPEDAFRWDSRGALIITDSCTGCGECAPACPYDAITMVPVGNTRNNSPLWRLWNGLRQLTTPIIPLEVSTTTSPTPVQRADKCDLCHGYDDLACVSACPTGALRLAPVEEILPL